MSYPDVSQCVLTGELVGKGGFGSVYRIDCPRSEPDSEDSIWLRGVNTDDRGYFVQKRFDSKRLFNDEQNVVKRLLKVSNSQLKRYVETLTPIIPQAINNKLAKKFRRESRESKYSIYYRLINGVTVSEMLQIHELKGGDGDETKTIWHDPHTFFKQFIEFLSKIDRLGNAIGLHYTDMKPENVMLKWDRTDGKFHFQLIDIGSFWTGYGSENYATFNLQPKIPGFISNSPSFERYLEAVHPEYSRMPKFNAERTWCAASFLATLAVMALLLRFHIHDNPQWFESSTVVTWEEIVSMIRETEWEKFHDTTLFCQTSTCMYDMQTTGNPFIDQLMKEDRALPNMSGGGEGGTGVAGKASILALCAITFLAAVAPRG